MAGAPCLVRLGDDVFLETEGSAEACVLAEMGEGEIGQRGADAACVIEEKQADRIDNGEPNSALAALRSASAAAKPQD